MEILTKINWVDVLVVIIMIRTSYIAFQDGLSHEIFPLISTVFIILLSLHYYEKIAVFISQNLFPISLPILNWLSFTFLVIITAILFKFLKIVLDKIIKVTWHPLVEKFGGLAAGIVRAAMLTSIVLMIIALMPLSYLQWSVKDRSLTGMYFIRIGPSICETVSRFLPIAKSNIADIEN